MIQNDADLDFMLMDAGKPVSFGVQSTFGILRRQSLVLPGEFSTLGQHVTLGIRDGTLNNLVGDAAISVGGAPFVIRDTGVVAANGLRTLILVDA